MEEPVEMMPNGILAIEKSDPDGIGNQLVCAILVGLRFTSEL